MAIVKRENRVLTVHEDILHTYLLEGYDQIDNEGNVVKRATGGRNVNLIEHNKVLDETDALRAKIKDLQEEIKVLEADNERLTKQARALNNNNKR